MMDFLSPFIVYDHEDTPRLYQDEPAAYYFGKEDIKERQKK